MNRQFGASLHKNNACFDSCFIIKKWIVYQGQSWIDIELKSTFYATLNFDKT